MWSRLSLRQKALLSFFVTSVVPLVVLNIVWSNLARSRLEDAAADRQSVLLESMSQRVNAFFTNAIDEVVSTSQDTNVSNLNLNQAQPILLQLSNRENEVTRIALVDSEGDEQIVIEDGAVISERQNIHGQEAFRVVTLFSNEPYVSQVNGDFDNPYITISVPLLSLGRLGDQNLTSAEALARRYGADITGALVVNVSLDELWQTVQQTRLGEEGYTYLVDQNGKLLSHPNTAFIDRDISTVAEVSEAIETLGEFDLGGIVENFRPRPAVSTSETGVDVLASQFPISPVRWAIIAEEPVSSVYSTANTITSTTFVILIVSVTLAVGIVLLITKTLVSPLRELTEGVLKLGQGNFTGRIKVAKGTDETAILGHAFNRMGQNLQNLLGQLKTQNAYLTAEQTKLQAVLNTIADGVLVLDQRFNIVLANKTAASFVGEQNPNALSGKAWLKVFALLYEDKPFSNDLLNGQLLYYHDVTMRSGDQPKFLDITALRLHDDPNGIAYILTIQDNTPRRELENMKLDFVSMAAHELRTPLTAISGYLSLLTGGRISQEEHESYVDLANANASMLESIINNMLSLSRIERNALVLNKKKLNWTSVITEEVRSLNFMATARRITIYTHLPEETLYGWGDEAALREVLGNLINNAVHYSDEGKSITVEVEERDGEILTTVSDNGPGIPEKLQGKLFTKYYRARGGLTTNSQGTGIGLFISKSIVDAHGGKIGVHSSFGHGSDFYFTIELFDETKHRQDASQSDTMASRGKVAWFKKDISPE